MLGPVFAVCGLFLASLALLRLIAVYLGVHE